MASAPTTAAFPVASAPRSFRAVSPVLISVTACALIALIVLSWLDGWSYYRQPASIRGTLPAHAWLRPSGPAGHAFGIAGFLFMLMPVAYAARKRVGALRSSGPLPVWLDAHVFCGIVGPVLVTFHTSFKFGGLVSVAYWSMVTVGLSGFAGRYLYVRIPRNVRGLELTRAELDARARELSLALAAIDLPPRLADRIRALERRVDQMTSEPALLGLLRADAAVATELRTLRRAIADSGVAPDLLERAVRLVAERAVLVRRTTVLQQTRRLFDLWHVFHLPLVYVMFLIVVLHVAVTIYLGYVPFRHS